MKSALVPADWRFRSDEVAVELRDVVENWSELERAPGAATLKSNALRDVVLQPATSGRAAVVVKRYRTRSLAERLKSVVVPSRARREWIALEALREQGIAAPRALGWAEHFRNGLCVEAGLAMELVDATPAPDFLDAASSADVDRFARLAGTLVARMHAGGIEHRDLHAGNLLVRGGADGNFELVILDVHAAIVGALVPESRRLAALGQFAHSLSRFLDARRLEILLDAYSANPVLDEFRGRGTEFRRRIEGERAGYERTRRASRSKRCFKNSSLFARIQDGAYRGFRSRDIESASVLEIARRDDPFTDCTKTSSSYRTGRLERVGQDDLFIKERRFTWLEGLVALVRRHPLERAWGVARAFDVAEVPTPPARFVITQRVAGVPRRAIFATDYRPALSLDRYARDHYFPPGRADAPDPRPAIDELARLVAQIHDLGIHHRDFAPKNWLVDTSGVSPTFELIDLDSVRHDGVRGWGSGAFGRLTDARRLRNLVQLGFMPEGHVRTRDRLRFVARYLDARRTPELGTRAELLRELRDRLELEFTNALRRMSLRLARTGEPSGDPWFDPASPENVSPINDSTATGSKPSTSA